MKGRVLIFLLAAGILTVLGARVARGFSTETLPRLSQVPEFNLTDHTGARFGAEQLHGRVWVADFVYTGCSAICPMLTARMGELQARLEAEDPEGRIGLISITVDPEGDTPERLAQYASRAEAKTGRWFFLTGEASLVEATVVKGFKISMGEDPSAGEDDFSIIHGGKLVLVDATGTIRGYFEPDEVDRITRFALHLADEAGASR